ncbi:hypothetical protein ACFL35_21965 [Candidatus Riflebacteria bacterium]
MQRVSLLFLLGYFLLPIISSQNRVVARPMTHSERQRHKEAMQKEGGQEVLFEPEAIFKIPETQKEVCLYILIFNAFLFLSGGFLIPKLAGLTGIDVDKVRTSFLLYLFISTPLIIYYINQLPDI